MAQKSGFFTSSSGDRKYGADWLAQYIAAIISNGVYTTEMTVSGDNGNMSVTVGAGRAWINGYMYSNDSDLTMALSAADGALSRTDLIVLRLDMTNRQITLAVVQGDFGGGVPTLTRTSDIYELCLAKIAVAAGTTEITDQIITDTRADETVCGIVAGAVTQLSTGELLEQLKAGFEEWFDGIKGQLSEDVAGNLQNQINDLPNTLKVTPTTAAKYFESPVGTETVDQVLSLLGRFQRGLGNEYVWNKTQTVTENVATTVSSTYPQYSYSSDANHTVTIQYADSIDLNKALVSPQTITVSYNTISNLNVVKGKYWTDDYATNKLFYTQPDAADAYGSTSLVSEVTYYSTHIDAVEVQSVASVSTTTDYGYVNSPDSDAYPPSVSDGYTYTLLGQIGSKVQIATGSYTGTGTYGSSNKNSLTFDFAPKILIIQTGVSNAWADTAIFIIGAPEYGGFEASVSSVTPLYGIQSISGNTISWYNSSNASYQLNMAYTYRYIAIG